MSPLIQGRKQHQLCSSKLVLANDHNGHQALVVRKTTSKTTIHISKPYCLLSCFWNLSACPVRIRVAVCLSKWEILFHPQYHFARAQSVCQQQYQVQVYTDPVGSNPSLCTQVLDALRCKLTVHGCLVRCKKNENHRRYSADSVTDCRCLWLDDLLNRWLYLYRRLYYMYHHTHVRTNVLFRSLHPRSQTVRPTRVSFDIWRSWSSPNFFSGVFSNIFMRRVFFNSILELKFGCPEPGSTGRSCCWRLFLLVVLNFFEIGQESTTV